MWTENELDFVLDIAIELINPFVPNAPILCIGSEWVNIQSILFNWKNKHGCVLYNQSLTISWRRSLSYKNQSIDLVSKSMDLFLYDRNLRHERVKDANGFLQYNSFSTEMLIVFKAMVRIASCNKNLNHVLP